MTENFYFPKIETRTSTLKKGVKKYVIKGYATVPDHVYNYKNELDKDGNHVRSFKEYFTKEGVANLARKAKSEKIWVDYGHEKGAVINIGGIFQDIETRSGLNLSEEKSHVLNSIKVNDIPMFKIEDLKVDDNGLFVEIHANPFYAEASEDHSIYFNSIWNSLESGFINGMSLNFNVTDTVPVSEGLRAINDVDLYGISLLQGGANDFAPITEVAVRCTENVIVRGDKECQKKRMLRMMM